MKTSRANLQPKATMSSSTSERPDNKTGAMRGTAHRSKKELLVLNRSAVSLSPLADLLNRRVMSAHLAFAVNVPTKSSNKCLSSPEQCQLTTFSGVFTSRLVNFTQCHDVIATVTGSRLARRDISFCQRGAHFRIHHCDTDVCSTLWVSVSLLNL